MPNRFIPTYITPIVTLFCVTIGNIPCSVGRSKHNAYKNTSNKVMCVRMLI